MRPLYVDSFAGGGGASTGIEAALQRPVDVAINHDERAITMHRANHPHTEHYRQNIWQVHPGDIAWGRNLRLVWFSPDCTHHSKAKGGRPIRTPQEKNSRDLAWVVISWARYARPDVIMLENVEEFASWGPLGADGRPCRQRAGETFTQWVDALRNAGYRVQYRELRAKRYGTPTVRKRLFLIARRDGARIVWPEPTHGPGKRPYRAAAECIDWALPTYSIFLTPDEVRRAGLRIRRPLAEATLKRIARGVFKYVIDSDDPFIVPVTHQGDLRVHSAHEPLRTVTTAARGEFALVAPCLYPRMSERPGQAPRCADAAEPMPTIVPKANTANLVTAFLAQHNSGLTGHTANEPFSTIVGRGSTQGLVAANIARHFGNSTGSACAEPLGTVTAGGGGKSALVLSHISHQRRSNGCGGDGNVRTPLNTITAGGCHHMLVKSFLMRYHGEGGQLADANEPLPTIVTRGRVGIVTVEGTEYRIEDIGMRMFAPRELFTAQGFPGHYVIDPLYQGKPLTKTAQIMLCGNSVPPQVPEALVRHNLAEAQNDALRLRATA